jgi:hypothetical protein
LNVIQGAFQYTADALDQPVALEKGLKILPMVS